VLGGRANGRTTAVATTVSLMRIGRNLEVRPLGGAAGCLTMILISIVASVLLTVLLNLVLR
jgi:hypothetical protein